MSSQGTEAVHTSTASTYKATGEIDSYQTSSVSVAITEVLEKHLDKAKEGIDEDNLPSRLSWKSGTGTQITQSVRKILTDSQPDERLWKWSVDAKGKDSKDPTVSYQITRGAVNSGGSWKGGDFISSG